MKRYLHILWLVGVALGPAACNFLELDESQYHTETFQFSTFDRTRQVATGVYTYVLDGFADVHGTMLDTATDDAVNVWETNGIKRFYDGSWTPTNTIDDVWYHYYAGIAAANYFLENCPEDFPDAVYTEDYAENLAELKNYPLEVRVLRALFHFELLKRYNSIVVADRSYGLEDVNTLSPVPYGEAARWIVSECDAAIPGLPDSHLNTAKGEIGRVTKGMARALKTRVLLYLASPLNNPDNDAGRWMEAARAAKEIIDSGVYLLADEETSNNEKAKGLIFGKWCSPSGSFESSNFPIGYEGGNSGVCPSQNLAEAFDLRDGTEFDWDNPLHRSLLPAERDPRFSKTLLGNGDMFKGEPVESFIGGRNGLPRQGGSPTSYYLRKHIKEETVLITGSYITYQHIFPLFRYAEVLLNYAEALFEAQKDPDFKGVSDNVSYTLSPREAVDMVRARAGMAPLPPTEAAGFRRRLRKERRVELAFEGHRFWDLRRWKEGASSTKIYGLRITAAGEGVFDSERVLVQSRYWDDKMYFYPVSDSELFKNHNLVQNDGW